MFGRGFLFSAILVAVVAVPIYLGENGGTPSLDPAQWWDSLWTDSLVDSERSGPAATFAPDEQSARQLTDVQQRLQQLRQSNRASADPRQALSPYPGAAGFGATVPRLTGPEVSSIAEIIRLDVNRQWIMTNWARVSTYLMDRNLEGLRVPVVSGTSTSDYAGSLTYFFDRRQTLQRVTFEGHTGDPTQVIALTTRYYGFQSEPSLGPGLFMARRDDQIVGALRIGQDSVSMANRPLQRFQVMLEINHPDSEFGLSDGFQHVLQQDRKNYRWTPDAQQEDADAG